MGEERQKEEKDYRTLFVPFGRNNVTRMWDREQLLSGSTAQKDLQVMLNHK